VSETGEVLKPLLAEIPGLALAILFGSRASGTARADSDVDIAILLNAPISLERKQSIIESIAAELGCPVDVVDLFEAPEPVLGEVLKGERLFGDNATYARLLTRHVINAADFLPLRQRILDERRSAWIR
jgi:uncharacterized protein